MGSERRQSAGGPAGGAKSARWTVYSAENERGRSRDGGGCPLAPYPPVWYAGPHIRL